MQPIKLRLKNRSYDIIVGDNILGSLGPKLKSLKTGSDAYIITNSRIKKKYAKLLVKSLESAGFGFRFKTVPEGETSKSIKTADAVINDIAHFDKKKKVFIIAFGGGVIGDLSGFIASIYKRGIPYVQVPTTLLSQVDSAIGGKTAVDLSSGKNLIGAIYQPRLVFSDISFLDSLDKRQIASGLAEVIKYGIIKDPQLFRFLEIKSKAILRRKPGALLHIVVESSKIKASVVSRDEREEKGLRTALNFGHTVGHAIEAASGFRSYSHGEAIALGMLVASEISRRLKFIQQDTFQRIEALIKKAGLPTVIKKVGLTNIINAHYYDKKFIGPKNRFVLTRGIGETKITENIPLVIIREAIKTRLFPLTSR